MWLIDHRQNAHLQGEPTWINIRLKMSQGAKHIVFTGRVQGVGFRFTAFHSANRHKLTGFVRNCADGTVEMLAQGPDENIDNCIREIKNSFPGYIRDTKTEEVHIDTQYMDFKITF
jgi:acylphosphatase